MNTIAGWLLDAPLYRDRFDAGRRLAAGLPSDLGCDTVVVGLARGGVQVASEIATVLGAPLDALAVRKVRHPYQPEYALGAVTPGGVVYLRSQDGLTEEQVHAAVTRARLEADELDRRLHESHGRPDCRDTTILLVDDGLATGATMIAAGRWARTAAARQVVAAVPVAAGQSVDDVRRELDLVYCPHVRSDLIAVGIWYADFPPLVDDDVLALLDAAEARLHAGVGSS